MSRLVGSDEDESNQEYVSEISTLEALMIQAILNQTTNIVASQNRSKRPTHEQALKSAEVLQSLAHTALILADAGWIHITPMKVQGLVNRAVLEDTLRHAKGVRNGSQSTRIDDEPTA